MKINDFDKEKLTQQYDKFAGKFNVLYLAGKERGREAMTIANDKACKDKQYRSANTLPMALSSR